MALLVVTATSLVWGQARRDADKTALPDFDLRASVISGEIPQSTRAKTAVARRTSEMDQFAAQRQANQPGIRLVPNRHGAPKLLLRDGAMLSTASSRDPDEIARDFLRGNIAAFGLEATEIEQLRLVVKDVTPDAAYLVYNQTLNGIDVFQGQVKFTLNRMGEIVQVSSGEVVPGLTTPTIPRLSPGDAESAARSSTRAEAIGQFARAMELVIFPLDAVTARLAYRMFLEVNAAYFYEILIDAEDGKLLFRHNTSMFAAQGRVWTQSPGVGARQLVTFPDAWLPPLGTVTTGNNVDAFIDVNGDSQPDALNTPELQAGRGSSATQLFDFPFGDGTLGLNPRDFRGAATTNLFYFVNLAHDYYYGLGFTEVAGNFQTDNFGQGGAGGDAIRAGAQNSQVTNNASFASTPDGTAPRMRLGLFTRGTSSQSDDLDTAYNGQTVIHEYAHGVSNRLVGGRTSTSCLSQIQSGALGEGWSDYFAISYFNNPVFDGYDSQNPVRGVRRQSYEGYTFTYEDVGNSGYEVHDDGEIWAAALWDLRKSLGQATTDRLVVNGLKGTPCNPSMTDARDAILSADLATNANANRDLIWSVFAKHGLGYSARGTDGLSVTGTLYDAAYDLPPGPQTAPNPAITSKPLSVQVGAGQLYTYRVTATNPNAGTLSFALSSGPPGMTVDPSGAVTWTATFTAQRVKITVTDGKGGKVVHGYLAPVFTSLVPGQSIGISGTEDSSGYASVNVPSGVPVLQMTLRGGTGDADLLVVTPDFDLETSARVGNDETLSFPNPKAGLWLVKVDGFASYAGVSLTASLVTPSALSPNGVVTGLSGVVGSETMYRLTVPAGVSGLQVSTSGGVGDVDLYLKFGSPVTCQSSMLVSTACNDDKFSEESGNAESITIINPMPGDWYIDLSAYEGYSGVSLTTSLLTGPPQPDLTISKSHAGNFAPGQTGARYTIVVTNAGILPTVGAVSVTDTLPAGLAATAVTGTGWVCALETLTCSRSDTLASAASYPPIAVTVNVAANAAASLTNVAAVSGGGDVNTANNAASDVTTVTRPVITLVANAFGDNPLIAPNTWVQIKGSGLAPPGDTRIWASADFANGKLPTQVDGVSATVNGKNAFVYFISPGQINILTPPDALSGPVQVQVTNNGITSNVTSVAGQARSLSFFEFVSGNLHYVYGRHADGSLIGPTSLFPGSSTPVKPGENIYIAATGFGPTDVPVVSGALTQSGNLPAPFPEVKVGGLPAQVAFAGLVGVGTVQINFTVPGDAPDGDLALTGTYNGLSIQPNLLITVRR